MKQNIKNYENYIIYDDGTVINTITKTVLSGSIGENGYKYYRLSKNGKKKMFYAHRLVAETFLANQYNLPVVNHKDGNKLNNNVNNLEWTTYSDNTKQWHQKEDINITRKKYLKYNGDEAEEEWLDIPNYNNYRISTHGRVHNKKTNNILQPVITCGYYKVRLCENGKTKDYMVHQLVYTIFNNDNDLQDYIIDHIDGNKLNNYKDNLQKVTISTNVYNALYVQKTNKSCKQVGQYNLQNELLNIFPSTKEASRQLGLDASSIAKVCRGNTAHKSCGGFIFKYI